MSQSAKPTTGDRFQRLVELMKMCRDTGNVKIYACSTTMAMMDVKKEELIDEVDEIVGAATFLDLAMDAQVQMFI